VFISASCIHPTLASISTSSTRQKRAEDRFS
jgi:hypothetical protein